MHKSEKQLLGRYVQASAPGTPASPGQFWRNVGDGGRATDEVEPIEQVDWGGRRVSNPRPPEPQSGVLPLNYAHHTTETGRFKFSPTPAKEGARAAGRASAGGCSG